MRFSRLVLIPFCIFLSQLSSAQSAEKWNLEKCIQYALQNNLQVRQAALTAGIESNNHLQSKLNLLPTIDAGLTFSNNFGSGLNLQNYTYAEGNSQSLQASLQANLPLWTGLQQIYNIQRTKYDLLASKYDYENAKNNMTLSVASAYLQILLNKEIVKVAEKQKELTESQLGIVKGRITAGALPQSAVYEVDAQIARDEATLVNTRNAVTIAILSLQQLLQLPGDKAFDVESPEVKLDNVADISGLSAESIYQFALNTQPSIKSADARIQSANIARKISYGALSPTISAFGNLSSGYFSQDRSVIVRRDSVSTNGTIDILGDHIPYTAWLPNPILGPASFTEQLKNNFRKVVGLSLNIPLFSRGQKILTIQNAKLQMQIRQLQADNAKNVLRQDIEQAYANAKAAAQTFLANEKSKEAAQKSYEAFEGRYKAGLASQFDLQTAQNNLIASESEIVKAKYTYVFRLKILDFYQGKPITLNAN